MRKVLFILLLIPVSVFSQVIGGSEAGMGTPRVAEPAKLAGGAGSGSVNLFTGNYDYQYDLGTISTPNGLAFNLKLANSSSVTAGNNVPLVSGVPYGEGWNLQLPKITIESEAFHKYALDFYEEDSTKTYTTAELKEEGDLYWFSPILNIPGITSSRLIYKYTINNQHVFVPNTFQDYVEARFTGQIWYVILSDGTQYTFGLRQVGYVNPTNNRFFWDEEGDTSLINYDNLKTVILPKEQVLEWYCTEISHPNSTFGEKILFGYHSFGAFNFFKELQEPQIKALFHDSINGFDTARVPWISGHQFKPRLFQDLVVYKDIMLKGVYAMVLYNEIERLELNYKTRHFDNHHKMLDIRDPGVMRYDSLYNYKIVKHYGKNTPIVVGTDTLMKPVQGVTQSFNEWYRYWHIMSDTVQAIGSGPICNQTNPYKGTYGGVTTDERYYRSVLTGDEISFSHGFLEAPRIGYDHAGTSDIAYGDFYELKFAIHHGGLGNPHDPNGGFAMYDINVASGEYTIPNNPDSFSAPANKMPLALAIDHTRSHSLFSTFNNAIKWSSVGKYPTDSKREYLVTSNVFFLPQIPQEFRGFNIQIGPANSALMHNMSPTAVKGAYEGGIYSPCAQKAYNNQIFLNLPGSCTPNGNRTNCLNSNYTKAGDRLAHNFGIGLPMYMMKRFYAALDHTDVGDDCATPRYRFWWNDGSDISAQWPNKPTLLTDTFKLLGVQLVRYSRNTYMLDNVTHSRLNGPNSLVDSSGWVVLSKYEMDYSLAVDHLINNRLYSGSEALDTFEARNLIQLRTIRNVPTDPTGDNPGFSYNPSSSPTTHFSYTSTGDTSLQNRNEYISNSYLLTSVTNELGGNTTIEYYPMESKINRMVPAHTIFRSKLLNLSGIQPLTNIQTVVTISYAVKTITQQSENGPQTWEYVYTNPISKTEQPGLGANFYDKHYTVKYGFASTVVFDPPLAGTGKRAFKTYLHHGHINDKDSTGLLFGRLYRVSYYDENAQPVKQHDYVYDALKVFENYRIRPGGPKGDDPYCDYFDNTCLTTKAPNNTIGLAANKMKYLEEADEYWESAYASENYLNCYFIRLKREISTDFEPDILLNYTGQLPTYIDVFETTNGSGVNLGPIGEVSTVTPDKLGNAVPLAGALAGKHFILDENENNRSKLEHKLQYSFINADYTWGDPLADYCNPNLHDTSYINSGNRKNWPFNKYFYLEGIERVKDYQYFDASFLGYTTSDGYKFVTRNYNVSDIDSLRLYNEPSFQLYSVTEWSPQAPLKYSRVEYFYYYDWLVNTHSNGYGIDGVYFSYRDMMRNIAFQKREIGYSPDDGHSIRNTYYFYDARWYATMPVKFDTVVLSGWSDTVSLTGFNDSLMAMGCTPVSPGTTPVAPKGKRLVYDDQDSLWYICPCTYLSNNGFVYAECSYEDYSSGMFNVTVDQGFRTPNIDGPIPRLALRDVVIQVDTVLYTQYSNFSGISRYLRILDFETVPNISPIFKRPVFEYDTLSVRRIQERNGIGTILKEVDVNRVVYEYKFDSLAFVLYTTSSGKFIDNGISFENVLVPSEVKQTAGTTVYKSEFEYKRNAAVAKTTDPNGLVSQYAFDPFGRLAEVKVDNEIKSLYKYGTWDNNHANSFTQRAAKNYVETITPTASGTNKAIVSRSLVDPLGRDFQSLTTLTDNYVTGGLGNEMVHSGTVLYDLWNRPIRNYKPFVYTNMGGVTFSPRYNTESLSYPQEYATVAYRADVSNKTLHQSYFNFAVDSNHLSTYAYTIIPSDTLISELALSYNEITKMMPGLPCRYWFYKTLHTDEDGKKSLSYTNAMGQAVAAKQYASTTDSMATLSIYNNQGLVKEVINPKKQATTYKYNLLGWRYWEKHPDKGLTTYMFNKKGDVAIWLTQNGRTGQQNPSGNVNTENRYYFGIFYDLLGRPLERYHSNLDWNSNTYRYYNNMKDTVFAPCYYYHYFDTVYWHQISYSHQHTLEWMFARNWQNMPNPGMYLDNTYTYLSEKKFFSKIHYDAVPQALYATAHPNALPYLDNSMENTLTRAAATVSYNIENNPIEYVFYAYTDEGLLKWELHQYNPDGIGTGKPGYLFRIDYPEYGRQGNLLESRVALNGSDTFDIRYVYQYDDWNQLEQVIAAYNYQYESSIAQFDYDRATGKLLGIDYLHQNIVADTLRYTYDIRERLVRINSHLFQWDMFYDGQQPHQGVQYGIQHHQNYNGNINATRALYRLNRSTNDPGTFDAPTWYGYEYDHANRLTRADAYTLGNFQTQYPQIIANYGDVYYTFDKIGNFTNVTRYRYFTQETITGTLHDAYAYTYFSANNNKLNQITNSTDNSLSRTYQYDGNGNMRSDDYRLINLGSMVRADLPASMDKLNSQQQVIGTTYYHYDAADRRLGKGTDASPFPTVWEYNLRNAAGQDLAVIDLNNSKYTWYVHGGQRLAQVHPPTGQQITLLPITIGTATYTYSGDPFSTATKVRSDWYVDSLHFFIYDHLGNTRVVHAPYDYNHSTKQYKHRLHSVLDYYPYGKPLRQWHHGQAERYLLSGNEKDGESGLDYFNARFYDSDVGRFLGVDALREKAPSWTSYRMAYGNPVMHIDPSGLLESKVVDSKGNEIGRIYDNSNAVYEVSTDDNGKAVFTFRGWDESQGGQNAESEATKERISSLCGRETMAVSMFKLGALMPPLHTMSEAGSGIRPSGDEFAGSDLTMLSLASIGFLGSAGREYLKGATFRLYRMRGEIFSPKIYHSGWGGGSAGRINTYSTSHIRTGLRVGGYGLGVVNGINIYNQYKSGQLSSFQLLSEGSSNAFTTVGGPYGAAWGVGWESGRLVAQTKPWLDFKFWLQRDIIGWDVEYRQMCTACPR